jgi:hypothetical protein
MWRSRPPRCGQRPVAVELDAAAHFEAKIAHLFPHGPRWPQRLGAPHGIFGCTFSARQPITKKNSLHPKNQNYSFVSNLLQGSQFVLRELI